MSMEPKVRQGVKDILNTIGAHIDADSEGLISQRLNSVASGDLPLVETVTPGEEEYAKALFAWAAKEDPKQIRKALTPVLVQLLAIDPTSAHVQHHGIRGVFDHFETGAEEFHAFSKLIAQAGASRVPPLPPREFSKHAVTHLALLLVSYLMYEEFHYPRTRTDYYNIADDMFEKLKWAYRYFLNQLEVVAPGTGIDEYFAEQDLHFPEREASESTRVSVTCAGDLLAVDVLVPENTPELFDGIADFYTTADIVSANLESPVAIHKPVGRTQDAGQAARMNTSIDMFDKFRKEGKINYFSVATNHSLDWDEQGVLETLDVLKESGADYSGTAASKAEQDDVIVVDKNGIKVGLLSYTFDCNGKHAPKGKKYLVNEVRFNDLDPKPDLALVKRQVELAKAKGAEYIIAYCHWGWEFEIRPHDNVMDVAQEVIDCGVDTILGNHPHVSQPMARVVRDGRPDGLIVYAFGDFVSYHPESRNSHLAYSTRFDIVKDDQGVYLANLQMLPLYILNVPLPDGRFDSRIVKFSEVYRDPDSFGLSELEKSHLPHLHDVVLHKILLPKDQKGILAE